MSTKERQNSAFTSTNEINTYSPYGYSTDMKLVHEAGHVNWMKDATCEK